MNPQSQGQVEAKPTKAYRVLERFEGYKIVIAWADNAEEAKDLVRKGDPSVLPIEDDGPHPAGIGECRREPSEDRA
jgi:hypothetical protein